MKKIVYATTNKGKFREVSNYLSSEEFQVVSLSDVSNVVPENFEVEETGVTFEENAILKARIYGEKLQELTLSEDTGLEVEVLSGRPGVYSKRYGPTDKARNEKLLKELEEVDMNNRKAQFVTVMALFIPETKGVVTFKGVMRGFISNKEIGKNGFGYDPIFINEYNKTNAEISLVEKNKISSRVRALEQVKKYLLI